MHSINVLPSSSIDKEVLYTYDKIVNRLNGCFLENVHQTICGVAKEIRQEINLNQIMSGMFYSFHLHVKQLVLYRD